MSEKIFNIFERVEGDTCISFEDGDSLYHDMKACIDAGKSVCLDFSNIEVFVTPFFNGALGQFFSKMSKEEFEKKIRIIPDDNEDLTDIINIVVENSIEYYKKRSK